LQEEPEQEGCSEGELMHQEGTNGIRNRDVKAELRLGNERTTRGIYRKSTGLEMAKRIARCTVGLKRIRYWSLWRGRPLSKITAVRGEACNVKARDRTTTDRQKGDFIRVPLGTNAYKERAVAMVGEWSPQTGKKHKRKHRARKKKRRCKRSPRKEKNGDTPLGYSGRTALKREQCSVQPKSLIILVKAQQHLQSEHILQW
jgi:hypothetical protein